MKKDKKDKKEKPLFHFEVYTEADQKRDDEKKRSEIKEENKSEYNFNGEPFYVTSGGHDFVFGWFNEYMTKTGIKAYGYHSGRWVIGSEEYYLNKKGEFEKLEYPERDPNFTFENVSFPIVKNVGASTLVQDLPSVQPKKPD